MGHERRSERTANLLISRLEALARAAGRLPHADAERLVELATVATMRAVALELLDEERAREIWHEARVHHPELPRLDRAVLERRAA